MSRSTFFMVQFFSWRGRQLTADPPIAFTTEDEAIRRADREGKTKAGVLVTAVHTAATEGLVRGILQSAELKSGGTPTALPEPAAAPTPRASTPQPGSVRFTPWDRPSAGFASRQAITIAGCGPKPLAANRILDGWTRP